jgi:hypothetical protein
MQDKGAQIMTTPAQEALEFINEWTSSYNGIDIPVRKLIPPDIFETIRSALTAQAVPGVDRQQIHDRLMLAVKLMTEPAEDGLHIMRAEAQIGFVLQELGLLDAEGISNATGKAPT